MVIRRPAATTTRGGLIKPKPTPSPHHNTQRGASRTPFGRRTACWWCTSGCCTSGCSWRYASTLCTRKCGRQQQLPACLLPPLSGWMRGSIDEVQLACSIEYRSNPQCPIPSPPHKHTHQQPKTTGGGGQGAGGGALRPALGRDNCAHPEPQGTIFDHDFRWLLLLFAFCLTWNPLTETRTHPNHPTLP